MKIKDIIIDLFKSRVWREELHPRDQYGRFTHVRGGSRVVTRTGRTGIVTNNDGKRITVRYDDGRTGTLARGNVIHIKDYEKVKGGTGGKKKKQTTRKPKAKKTTTRRRRKTTTSSAKKPNPTIKQKPKGDWVSNYNSSERPQIGGVIRGTQDNTRNEQNRALQEFVDASENRGLYETLDRTWTRPVVQKILRKKPENRTVNEIQQVAGRITEDHINLAHEVANARVRGMGLPAIYHEIGESVTGEGYIAQETGLYADIMQSARASMYETLYNVLSGSDKPPHRNTTIGAHVVNRMKQRLTRDIYDLLNDIPVPHRIRRLASIVRDSEQQLGTELGRQPTIEELAQYLEANSSTFREATVMEPPVWDDEQNTWVNTERSISDPVEKLKVYNNYIRQQRTLSIDHRSEATHDGDEELTLQDRIASNARTDEERLERMERQYELEGEVPRAMEDMELHPNSIEVMKIMFSEPSQVSNMPYLTQQEVADITGKSRSWVAKWYREGMKAIKQAHEDNHPALERLRLLKSYVLNMILRSQMEMDLVKSMVDWGLDHTALEEHYIGVRYGSDLLEIKKSLQPHEYVNSYIVADNGRVRASIVEKRRPTGKTLLKAFQEFNNGLRKSLFPHRGKSQQAINEKASSHVRNNKSRYSSMHSRQQAQLKAKQRSGEPLTWSQELALKENGFWITWGGKKILIRGSGSGFGEIIYDSSNEEHRVSHNKGAQEDKVEYHHVEDDRAEEIARREKEAQEYYDSGSTPKSWRAWAKRTGAIYDEDKKEIVVDEDGKLVFEHDEDSITLATDHGIQAFEESVQELDKEYRKSKLQVMDEYGHRLLPWFATLSEEEREAVDKMTPEERIRYAGETILDTGNVREILENYIEEVNRKRTPKSRIEVGEKYRDMLMEHLNEIGSRGSRTINTHREMIGRANDIAGIMNRIRNIGEVNEEVADILGTRELALARTEAGKHIKPEGTYIIGNPIDGKTLHVRFEYAYAGGRGGIKDDFTAVVKEAFDPETGEHHTFDGVATSWGQLGKLIGVTSGSFDSPNRGGKSPLMKQISEEEYMEARGRTRLGLTEDMIHTDFRKVDERRDNEGNVVGSTYAMDMPDGTQNVFEVGRDGQLQDPLLARLIKGRGMAINNEEDLHNLLANSVGNTTWATLHVGSDIHTGDALGHHVKLLYDGKGAPIVQGGRYDGYRYIDSADIPEGTIDPATGEPIKALFSRGRLVDRRFTTKHDIPMKKGNTVMYPHGNGFRKGTITEVRGNNLQVIDARGNLVGFFNKNELRHDKVEGSMRADSGNVVVKLDEVGNHAIDTREMSAEQKKRLVRSLELSGNENFIRDNGEPRLTINMDDDQMNRLRKSLQRSKVGREIIPQIESHYQNQLRLHVPEDLIDTVKAEGVKIDDNGIADISIAKFEELRDVLNNIGNGVSLEQHARSYLNDHFRSKDRTPREIDELRKLYQPSQVNSGKDSVDKFYKEQFKEDSFLMDPKSGLYSTQLEAIAHMVEAKRGIAGHGMGTGKTIAGVIAFMQHKARTLAQNKKPKKALVVAPKGIMTEWSKEIGNHTNSSALFIGTQLTKTGEDGKRMRSESGRNLFGQDGTEMESLTKDQYLAQMKQLSGEGQDFHIMNYETFTAMADEITASGMYDTIIVDEAHAFKNPNGARGKALNKHSNSFENVWGLTGTPMENNLTEMYNLVNTFTGGMHELGTLEEFRDNYMIKDRNGKITGINPNKADDLGDKLAQYVQFRSGTDVKKNDGSRIHFPHLTGSSNDAEMPNDFVGDLVDRSRDHTTNSYYGTKHSITDYDTVDVTATSQTGEKYTVKAHTAENMSESFKQVYDVYKELEGEKLPESQKQLLARAVATGAEDQDKSKGENFLTAMQSLQKFLNAPLARDMYIGEGFDNAVDSTVTDRQDGTQQKAEKDTFREYRGRLEDWTPGAGNYIVDEAGHKRYFQSDGKGSVARDEQGRPKLLAPLHHNNPKAQYLQQRITKYLDGVRAENRRRRANGQVEIMPKLIVKSSYTVFGTDIVDNVIRDLSNPVTGHPELMYWSEKMKAQGKTLTAGSFTGESRDRERIKDEFRGNKNNYAEEQGNMWATSISPAGKEGIDLGNAHFMIHYDQEWNPAITSQFTARSLRSDSEKSHSAVERPNTVRVESLHIPGTIEDFLFSAQDQKMETIEEVTRRTKGAESEERYGDSASTSWSASSFTRSGNRRVGQRQPKRRERSTARQPEERIAKSLRKSLKNEDLKLVIRL